MTICVSVKVSEGLVLATDSASAVIRQVDPNRIEILKTYQHARKLSHIKDYPIGTMSWGQGLVGARSVASLIKEFEYNLPSAAAESEKIQSELLVSAEAQGSPRISQVKSVANGLCDVVKRAYDAAYTNPQARPSLGILVSGYSSGKFFPEQWIIDLPASEGVQQVRPDVSGRPDFGANWYGLTDAIVRLHFGRDDRLIAEMCARFGISKQEAIDFTMPLQYPVIFDGMPLQEAIDYAEYLVNVVIGRFRFTIGPQLCGGDVDIAVITPNAFTWIQRKTWRGGGKGRASVL